MTAMQDELVSEALRAGHHHDGLLRPWNQTMQPDIAIHKSYTHAADFLEKELLSHSPARYSSDCVVWAQLCGNPMPQAQHKNVAQCPAATA